MEQEVLFERVTVPVVTVKFPCVTPCGQFCNSNIAKYCWAVRAFPKDPNAARLALAFELVPLTVPVTITESPPAGVIDVMMIVFAIFGLPQLLVQIERFRSNKRHRYGGQSSACGTNEPESKD